MKMVFETLGYKNILPVSLCRHVLTLTFVDMWCLSFTNYVVYLYRSIILQWQQWCGCSRGMTFRRASGFPSLCCWLSVSTRHF